MKEEHRNGGDFDFLIGKSIKKVNYTERKGWDAGHWELICNDNTKIIVEENEGCGGCGNGWSSIDLKKLEENNNVITNIEVKYAKDCWECDEFTMFVYYEDNTINQLNGDDGYGNGYYGGGFYITITNVESQENI